LFLLGTSRTTGWPTILAILVVLLLAGELAYVGYLRGWLVTVRIQQQGPIKLSPGRSQQFTAVVKYTRNQRVLWWIDPSVGVISDSGLYTAPASLGPQRQVNIVAASEQYPSKKAIVQVKLLSPPLAISGKQTLPPGESTQFVAKAGDDVVKEVYWSLDPSDASSGTINNEGLYTAPPSAAAQKTITVIATSQAEPENSAKSTITIIQAELAISPGSATLQPSQPTTFTAMSGSNPAAVVWSINPQGIGAITQAGVYTAPAVIAAGQSITVIATSRTNPAVSAHATISLVRGGAPLTFSVAPGHVDLGAMDEQQFEIAPKPGEQIQWSHPALGRISPQGKYTAPPMVHGSQQITIIATVEGSPARAAVITLHPVEVSQPSCVLASHSQYHCSAPVRYAPPQREGVSWSITPEFGSISQADGVYTAPAAIPNDMDVTVIAKSLFDPIASNRQIIHLPRIPVKVRRNVRIVMSSSHPQVLMNLQRARFSATVTGSDNSGVSWTVDGPGTIDQQSGVYLAPGYIHDGDTVRVTAASNADPSQVATTTLTLRNYTGPDIGTIHWKNETDINQALTIEGTQVSTGTLIGQAWPPVTVQIDNIPGWTIVEPPSIENDWKRLVIRPKNGAKHKVSITWRVNHYH